MSEQSENPTVVIKPPGNILGNKFFVNSAILFVGFFLGFFAFSISPFGKAVSPATPQKPTIDESKLPISLSLLTNPIIYEWSGSIEGKLTQVDTDSYVIKDDKGNNITIYYKTPSGGIWKTAFFSQDKAGSKEIKINTIPIGTQLRGSLLILKGAPNTPIGSSFSIVK